MNRIDSEINIFWLSDIHFSLQYDDLDAPINVQLKEYISSFVKYSKTLSTKIKFDYLLISGDIAQSGDVKEFELFHANILNPLKKHFKDAKLLVVPGNHDVFRDSASAFTELFVNNISNKRVSFFGKNRGKFKIPFENYSALFKKMNWSAPTSLKRNKYLYGYHIDFDNKVLFLMLNSSWYSVGDEGFLIKYLKDNLSKKKDINTLAKEISHISNEYGKQVLGLEMIPVFKKIIALIDKYNDFLIVTTMHHPINWFDWGERIPSKGKRFAKIRENSDLLLTGHEHVPKYYLSEKIENDSLLHIQAGCLMDFPGKSKEFVIKDNWFSTLKINTNKRTVTQYKHAHKKGVWGVDKVPRKKLNKSYSSKLSEVRIKSINDCFTAEKYLSAKYKDLKPINERYFLSNDMLISTITKDYKKVNFNLKITELKNLIEETNVNNVMFLFYDIFHGKFEDYSLLDNNIETLDVIKNDFDNKFDKFRYDFFKKLKNENVINKYKDLSFRSLVIPYWELEKYLK